MAFECDCDCGDCGYDDCAGKAAFDDCAGECCCSDSEQAGTDLGQE